MAEARLSPHAELDALSDNALLARLRPLPHGSAEREAICEILVGRYALLVRSCVRPYLASPEPAEDLLQVGYVGLLKAINGFDPGYGDSLSAYAIPCISGEIKRHFRDRRWQIRVRRQDQELLLEMRAAEEELTQRQIGDRLGISQMHVSRLLERALAYLRTQITEPA